MIDTNNTVFDFQRTGNAALYAKRIGAMTAGYGIRKAVVSLHVNIRINLLIL